MHSQAARAKHKAETRRTYAQLFLYCSVRYMVWSFPSEKPGNACRIHKFTYSRSFVGDTIDFAKANCSVCDLIDGSIFAQSLRAAWGGGGFPDFCIHNEIALNESKTCNVSCAYFRSSVLTTSHRAKSFLSRRVPETTHTLVTYMTCLKCLMILATIIMEIYRLQVMTQTGWRIALVWISFFYTIVSNTQQNFQRACILECAFAVDLCCSFFGLSLSDRQSSVIDNSIKSDFASDLHRVNKKFAWRVMHQCVIPAMADRLNIITELLCVKFNFTYSCHF